MTDASGLYTGIVSHSRLRPRRHSLRYRVFWTLFDLAELETLDRRSRLFSHNRFNLFAFHDRDHGDGSGPLRPQIVERLVEAGVDLKGGAIRLLCMPRLLGYVFNPISVYFCHRPDGGLAALIYEVTNTFGARHSYLIPTKPGDEGAPVIRQRSAKQLYVSPFMDMDLTYDFKVTPPGESVALQVRCSDADGLMLTATMAGRRSALTDAGILRAAATHPLLTLKVVAGIHWEALMLFLKGVRLTRQPAPPKRSFSIVR
ncbi:MAG: DUF1365 family protein [Caulobacter sp.]|nr:DUF1365 family protein [Caulobacter sp.]